MAAPCEWDVDPVALGVCSTWTDYPEPLRESALELASTFLYGATGRRFGVCPVVVRPSQGGRWEGVAYQAFPVAPGLSGLGVPGGPFLFGGRWYNAGCGGCCGSAGCAVVLRGPVAEVTQVRVDGETVPASAYRVDLTGGAYLLVRVDGGCWPSCQNFTAAPDEAGSFEVAYGLGLALPVSLQVATALLACEYAKGLTGGPCKLPSKMTRLSRQGVEVELEPPAPADGKTGIREVDDVIQALNPGRRQRPPVVLSPDLPEACDRVTVLPAGS